MRCLLGVHMMRNSTWHLEVAFKALRKWAQMQHHERAMAALATLQVLGGGPACVCTCVSYAAHPWRARDP